MSDDGKIFSKIHAAAVADLRARQADALAGLRKREIADTAARLFAEKGYHQTAIADIARALSIGHGTVYRYFENKRDILDDILDDLAGRLLSAATVENAPDAATTPATYRRQVEHFAREFWRLYDTDPAVRMVLRHADGVDPELSARVDHFVAAAARFVTGYLENGQARGFIDAGVDIEATGQVVLALIIGSLLCIRDDEVTARQRYTNAAITMLFAGVIAN